MGGVVIFFNFERFSQPCRLTKNFLGGDNIRFIDPPQKKLGLLFTVPARPKLSFLKSENFISKGLVIFWHFKDILGGDSDSTHGRVSFLIDKPFLCQRPPPSQDSL